ncbi:MAG: RNA 2',3'-cyclic phosphodiesterase [Candidatus Thermoplasmatota archaeon]|nr:RNA 2',3'-cyclic phosphodiesterase [Candidatus Thermoplasmatota archaeon]
MVSFRGFIAIDIEPFSILKNFQQDIKKTGANVKLVEPENVHITLKFIGDTPEEQIDEICEIISSTVAEIKPFEIRLKGAGVFPNESYLKVIWVGMSPVDTISTISKILDEKLASLGFEKEKKNFSPHLTIGRVRSAQNKDELIKVIEKYKEITFKTFQVSSIKLKKSQLTPKGPIYSNLKEISL